MPILIPRTIGQIAHNTCRLTKTAFKYYALYLNAVFPQFSYYGPQAITWAQWGKVEGTWRNAKIKNVSVDEFFFAVSKWLDKGNQGASYFWILGI